MLLIFFLPNVQHKWPLEIVHNGANHSSQIRKQLKFSQWCKKKQNYPQLFHLPPPEKKKKKGLPIYM